MLRGQEQAGGGTLGLCQQPLVVVSEAPNLLLQGCPVRLLSESHFKASLGSPLSEMGCPSRDSDSRIVLQVEAISEMDCHSSSRVSLPASDIILLMEFRRDKVLGRMEALSSGPESLVSSWLLGLPDWSWEGGVSLSVPGADGLAVVTRRRSGVVLGRTGASSDRELPDDRELWLRRNSVLSSVRSPGPGGLLLSFRQKCSSCLVGGNMTNFPVSSCTGSGPPRRLGSFRESI